MTVFRQYFKIVKSYLPLISVYVVIFIGFTLIFSLNGGGQTNFTAAKPKIAIIDHDQSPLSNLLIEQLEEQAKRVVIEEEKQEDALFFRKVDVILTIPNEFQENLTKGKPLLTINRVPDSSNSLLLEQYINQFLQFASIYQKSGLGEEEMAEAMKQDLKEFAEIHFLSKDHAALEKANSYYNFFNYIFMALCISIIGIIMASFIDPNIKRRNLVSSTSTASKNRQLFLGNACYTFLLWAIFIVVSLILYGKALFTIAGALLILNSFLFALACLSLGFLIGSFIKNKEAQNGLTNVLALGSSFIAGAFVPQAYLGNFVLGIAKFTPSYWFIKNNNEITLLSNVNWDTLTPIFLRMGMLVIFAGLFFLATNVIGTILRKRKVN